jgi:predicted O-methyltransferase YrrM
VIKPQKFYYAFQNIEYLRLSLLKNTQNIEVQDFGAGSRIFSSNQRAISQVTKHSVSSIKKARLLFKLVNHFQPQTILELGTSFGITTLYLASARTKACVYTFEGCEETAEIAQHNFRNYAAQNIQLILGKLEDTLANTLQKLDGVDFVFLDAHHQLKPTLEYFELCLTKSSPNTLLVLDDIHWSKEMEQVWQMIQTDKRVSLTIDLFSLGLVFLKKDIEKQNFILRF